MSMPEDERDELRRKFEQYAESRDPGLRDHLVTAHLGLAEYLARRFANRGEPLDDLIQVASVGLLKAVDRFALPPLFAELPRREQVILHLRFFEGLTQSEIAGRLGISQMHVSRLLARSLAKLRGSADEA